MPANYVLLETIELTQSASSVTLDSIPQTGYTDLKLVMSTRCSATFGNSWYDTYITVNSGAALSWRDLIGLGSGTPSSRTDTTSFVTLGVTSSGATASTFGNTTMYLPNYNSTTTYKTVSMESVSENNASGAAIQLSAGLYSSNTAISSITITPYNSPTAQFVQYSTFSLYGVAAFGTTPVTAPKATGGNIIANDGTYWYHAFLTSGTFTPQLALAVDVLTVAGGGGATDNSSGGGGAGGLVYASSQSLTSINHAVVVGAGGAGTGGAGIPSGKGSNSQFASLTAAQGGGGSWGRNFGPSGAQNGGCGGGAVGSLSSTGGTGSQGFAGGNANSAAPNYGAGGGGGMGAVGGNGNDSAGGAGGNGLSTYSSWGAATLTGQNIGGTYWYAGGGGGGINANTSGSGAGGNGGGGAAVPAGTTPNSGIIGTGGGGGASGYPVVGGGAGVAGSGGSGIVIIRYAMV